GEYRITAPNADEFLRVSSSNITLCGAGKEQTFIKFDPYRNGEYQMAHNRGIRFEPSNDPYDTWQPISGTTVKITKDLPLPTKIIPVDSVAPFSVANNNEIII